MHRSKLSWCIVLISRFTFCGLRELKMRRWAFCCSRNKSRYNNNSSNRSQGVSPEGCCHKVITDLSFEQTSLITSMLLVILIEHSDCVPKLLYYQRHNPIPHLLHAAVLSYHVLILCFYRNTC